MKFLKYIINIVSSKKITLTIINILGILLIGVLIMANSPIWQSAISIAWVLIRPFLFGFIIAFALNPFINFIEKHLHNRSLSIAIIYISGIALILLLIGLIIPMLYNSVSELLPSFDSGLEEIRKFVENNFNYDISSLVKYIRSFISQILEDTAVLDTTLDVINRALSTVTNFIIYLILALYMSGNYRNIRNTIKKFAYKINVHLPSYLVQIDYSLILYIKAFMIGAIVQSLMACVIFLIVGHPNWILLGLLSGVSSVFPYIGPVAVNCLGIITSLSMGATTIVILLVLIFIQSIVMSYVITPRIYSSQIDLSVISVLFGILSGSTLFGIWGMVIAMPILVSVKIVYRLYKEHHELQHLQNNTYK